MEIKINKFAIVVFVLCLFLGFFLFGKFVAGVQHRSDSENLANQLKTALDSTRHYKVIIGGLERDVAEKASMVLTKDEAIQSGLIEKEKYKKLYLKSIEHNTKLETQVQVLLDSIHGIKPEVIYIYIESEKDSIPFLRLPYEWEYKDKFLNVYGKINDKALTSLRLDMGVDLDVTIGQKKHGLPSVLVSEDNPYFYVNSIKNIKVVDSKWYQKDWIKYGLGFVAGAGLVIVANH